MINYFIVFLVLVIIYVMWVKFCNPEHLTFDYGSPSSIPPYGLMGEPDFGQEIMPFSTISKLVDDQRYTKNNINYSYLHAPSKRSANIPYDEAPEMILENKQSAFDQQIGKDRGYLTWQNL